MGLQIAENLKKAREAVGLTPERAADLSGVSKSSIYAYENGQEPKFSQLARLASTYRRPVDFFLSESSPPDGIMLWRDPPANPTDSREVEAEFRQLCEQYHRLEQLMSEPAGDLLPKFDTQTSVTMDYPWAETLAEAVGKAMGLGEIPACSLKQTLEEKYAIKIFYRHKFSGSAISTRSEVFGNGILLKSKHKRWRRNFDLAHELFHLLTWDIFRKSADQKPDAQEEKLANAFASRLLLPTDGVRRAIEQRRGGHAKIGLSELNDIAHEFDISLDALLWRLKRLYTVSESRIDELLEQSRQAGEKPAREDNSPVEILPERYQRLAIRALHSGRLSLMQFAKYMRISYWKSQDYLDEGEGFTDEEISLSIA